ncbi:MAG: Galactose-1-phosphate uridylyltransferase [Parcubacteria group bacterium GW2011_GWB1_45_7]|uniref:Galactose-1-phosphate uridylyltransferase, UDPglucose--hexose-1-phosphate uridylyltransferase n=4 Tax=Parcubacteria group TaxID=1794811 RepID=A0A0H4TC68_9BACT|nr:galactose-1-phosphate uridylyltransferase, UDPglucose--hexose-1-phosphate uridylyltransferase [uncultured Parcubacteria bacterium Rifle_16ft_4_minimus_37647]AKQ05613.1 galactose-1-phosphate uridylyltransferase, UDPglucose--hexose-1-phosphate uridylyltransferase [uncultured Parcubacteria bacterium Rifle_16ft_4_minimus_23790]KKU11915.1 MAG: Galactose-1-phosphate uridylyltransferase [Parcubacteria group bacterium GW2011_GWB1_45_7]OGY58628.1 MAG: hypothetical protein A3C03_02560 [Candidatus Colwe
MNEFRQDLVSGDWVLISPSRGRRPHDFKAKKRKRAPKIGCKFENPREAASGGKVILSEPDGKYWKVQAILNKYPAVTKDGLWVIDEEKEGPFFVLPGYGYHEVIITRDHHKAFPDLDSDDAFLVLKVFRQRYRSLANDNNIAYIHTFANFGETAGATIYHPHYQILAIPIIPPDVRRSLHGSANYKEKNDACVHCTQINWEVEQKKRIICETKDAIVFAPYASKEPFEMRVFPKKHHPYFEDTDERELGSIGEALQTALKRLKKALNDPDYNFFIHTAPSRDREKYSHYHWHIEVVPRTNISAGFELGTSVEVNPMDPDDAASFLRDAK